MRTKEARSKEASGMKWVKPFEESQPHRKVNFNQSQLMRKFFLVFLDIKALTLLKFLIRHLSQIVKNLQSSKKFLVSFFSKTDCTKKEVFR